MKLKPLLDDILFVFNDTIERGNFVETYGRIYLGRSQEGTIRKPRWGKVLAIGPDVSDEISEGDNILIEPLMWTPGLEYDDVKIWKTAEHKVIGVAEE